LQNINVLSNQQAIGNLSQKIEKFIEDTVIMVRNQATIVNRDIIIKLKQYDTIKQ